MESGSSPLVRLNSALTSPGLSSSPDFTPYVMEVMSRE